MAQPQGPSNAEQFKQSFREEAREILTELESALLALNENPKDTELVSRIFRGLHTIKGSGAMFGFEKLASFTPVSYTHLDVYKRQDTGTMSRIPFTVPTSALLTE